MLRWLTRLSLPLLLLVEVFAGEQHCSLQIEDPLLLEGRGVEEAFSLSGRTFATVQIFEGVHVYDGLEFLQSFPNATEVAVADRGRTIAVAFCDNDDQGLVVPYSSPCQTSDRIRVLTTSTFDQWGSDIVETEGIDKVELNEAGDTIALFLRETEIIKIYQFDGTDWFPLGDPIAPGFYSVTLALAKSDPRVAVASRNGWEVNRIKIYAYSPIRNRWIQEAMLEGDGIDDYIGWSLAFNGNGDLLLDGNNHGKVRLFERHGTTWRKTYTMLSRDTDQFGSSVAISQDGTRVVVGAPRDENGRGTVHVFNRNNSRGEFSSIGRFGGHADLFGAEVAVDGNWVVTGGVGAGGFSYIVGQRSIHCEDDVNDSPTMSPVVTPESTPRPLPSSSNHYHPLRSPMILLMTILLASKHE